MNTPPPRWKRLVAVAMIGISAMSISGCGIEFDFPEVEFDG